MLSACENQPHRLSRSPQGERGLKSVGQIDRSAGVGRSPQGERGLKSTRLHRLSKPQLSLPARGAWIEISHVEIASAVMHGRSPQGERGLKSELDQWNRKRIVVAPRKGSVD